VGASQKRRGVLAAQARHSARFESSPQQGEIPHPCENAQLVPQAPSRENRLTRLDQRSPLRRGGSRDGDLFNHSRSSARMLGKAWTMA
jgi:hypothetical protein